MILLWRVKMRIRYWLLDMAHDDGPFAPRPGNWHHHHDLLERIAYRYFS